jgi:hypothetical protein
LAKALIADVELGTKLRAAERVAGAGDGVEQAAIEFGDGVIFAVEIGRRDREVDVALVAGHELDAQWIRCGGGAMFDREQERVFVTAEVEVRVAPGVEVATAPEREAGLAAGAAVLARVMDDEHGDVELALEGAEVAEQGGDLAGVVLVDAVQAHERVEHEQPGCEAANGSAQARLVASAIEAKDRNGDDVDRRAGQLEAARATDALTTGAASSAM